MEAAYEEPLRCVCNESRKNTDGGRGSMTGLMAYSSISRWSGARAYVKEQRPAFHAAVERVEADPRIADIFRRHWPPK